MAADDGLRGEDAIWWNWRDLHDGDVRRDAVEENAAVLVAEARRATN